MTDKLSIYNGALREIGEVPLTSLTENRASRKKLDASYDEAVQNCLESGLWKFALRDAAVSSSSTSSIGYTNIFTKPSDHLKLAGVCQDAALRQDIDDEYQEYTTTWQASYSTIYIKYVSSDASYGLNLSAWTASFTNFVQKYLAFLISSSAANSETIKEQLFGLSESAKQKALELDEWQKPKKRAGILSGGNTKLSVYNGALRELGQPLLLSLNENREAIEYLDATYDRAVKYCLESGQWVFAAKMIKFEPSTSIEPSFGYQYFYEKPNDYLKLVGIWTDEFMKVPVGFEYDEDKQGWYASSNEVYIKYISSDVNYGHDLSKCSSSFTLFVERYLAYINAVGITKNEKATAGLRVLVRDSERDARNVDAWGKPAKRIPQGSWVSARHGYRNTRNNGGYR